MHYVTIYTFMVLKYIGYIGQNFYGPVITKIYKNCNIAEIIGKI